LISLSYYKLLKLQLCFLYWYIFTLYLKANIKPKRKLICFVDLVLQVIVKLIYFILFSDLAFWLFGSSRERMFLRFALNCVDDLLQRCQTENLKSESKFSPHEKRLTYILTSLARNSSQLFFSLHIHRLKTRQLFQN
jgi:hypothetical protein